MKYIKGTVFVAVFILMDQLTKLWAFRVLRNNGPIEIIKGIFELRYLENTGAAFGMMENQIIYFVLITPIIIGIICYFYFKTPNQKKYFLLQWIMILLTAGAVGNLIDRIRLKYVIDFLYFKVIHFPIFNLADCYVTISAFMLLVSVFFIYQEEDFSIYKRNKETNKIE